MQFANVIPWSNFWGNKCMAIVFVIQRDTGKEKPRLLARWVEY